MRKFTTLFLLALAMTIGANQAFAQQAGGSNDTGKQERPDRPDRDGDDGGDPVSPRGRLTLYYPCTPIRPCEVPPGHRNPKPPVVQVEPEDCSCVHKVMRVNGRFMPFIDCYQSIEVNGREQLRYCRNGNES